MSSTLQVKILLLTCAPNSSANASRLGLKTRIRRKLTCPFFTFASASGIAALSRSGSAFTNT